MNILEYLRQNNIDISAPCGGNGTCGKCLVSIDDGEPVRACRIEYRQGMDIRVVNGTGRMVVLAVGDDMEPDSQKHNAASEINRFSEDKTGQTYSQEKKDSGRYGIAIDIGTTTIASVICDAASGVILSKETALNPNISFGADVISRIQAGINGNAGVMRERLLEKIREHIFKLAEKETTDTITIDTIAVAGNTTMIHTLMGHDLAPLGKSPYKPVHTEMIRKTANDIFKIKVNNTKNSHTVIFPGVSAFVGGDIISGLYYLNSKKTKDIYALIDLGTNGEMAIVTPDSIYTASSPAGSVFEGGGISCGVGSVSGAIDHVHIDENGKSQYTTIDNEKLIKGICGTGAIDCASELLRTGLCGADGAIDKDYIVARYPDRTPVCFTQEDMRQMQLAKAAIAAGFEILCKRAGITYEDISALYLAGGMGFSLDIDSAVNIGLVPEDLASRVHSTGNSSLLGAVRLACADDREKALGEISAIADKCSTIDLASDPSFQDTYISHIDLRHF